MKNRNLWICGVIVLMLCFGANVLFMNTNKNEKKELTPTIDKVRGIAELATLKTRYHNVAKYNDADTVLLFLKNNKKLWIEYEGTVSIGTDISHLNMEIKGDNINVSMPHSKILTNGCSVDEKSLDKKHYYSDKEGFFVSNITSKDEKKAYGEANKSMKKETKKNTMLFVQADERAEELIKNYIKNVGKMNNKNYKVSFTYVDD